MSEPIIVSQIVKELNANSSGTLSKTILKACLFGGAAALCAYAGYRTWNYFYTSDETEDEWFLARESLDEVDNDDSLDDNDGNMDDDDSSDDDDDAYVTASEEIEDES